MDVSLGSYTGCVMCCMEVRGGMGRADQSRSKHWVWDLVRTEDRGGHMEGKI